MTTSINNPMFFLHNYCNFDQPNRVYLLVGMSRNKDNDGDFHHFMRRYVVASHDDIDTGYAEIMQLGNLAGTTYRMYVSVNARDSVKAMFHFQQKLAELGKNVALNIQDGIAQTTKLQSLWKTELDQRRNRIDKRILIDVDEDDGMLASDIATELKYITEVHAIRRTVTGYAIVADACDTRAVMDKFKIREIDLQRDSMIFVEQWHGHVEDITKQESDMPVSSYQMGSVGDSVLEGKEP